MVAVLARVMVWGRTSFELGRGMSTCDDPPDGGVHRERGRHCEMAWVVEPCSERGSLLRGLKCEVEVSV